MSCCQSIEYIRVARVHRQLERLRDQLGRAITRRGSADAISRIEQMIRRRWRVLDRNLRALTPQEWRK